MTRARVKPELIRWVREDAGLQVEDVAKKTGTKAERVEAWEEGTLQPTLRQLRLLANAAKRPLAIFYLPEPPRKFRAMHDFRRMPGDPMAEGSPALRLAIRGGYARREVALELASALGDESPTIALKASLDERVADVAQRAREFLGIPLAAQKRWSGAYDGLNAWRSAMEAKGVLVFQATGVDLDEMRGFSIAESELPVIVLNIRDAPNGRVFTLLHEFCHLVLRQGGLCDLTEHGSRPPEDIRIEVFCNAVASETLVPASALMLSPTVHQHGPGVEWTPEELRRLAREFSVSREVVLRRLLEARRTTQHFYESMRRQFLEEYEQRRQSQSGYAPPDVAAVSYAGAAFVRLVLNSYYQEKITSRDVSEFLGVKLKHLPNIEERVMGKHVMFA